MFIIDFAMKQETNKIQFLSFRNHLRDETKEKTLLETTVCEKKRNKSVSIPIATVVSLCFTKRPFEKKHKRFLQCMIIQGYNDKIQIV